MSEFKIELFFLKNFIRVTLFGMLIILAFDLIFTRYDLDSLIMDVVVLAAALVALILLKKKFYELSVIVITAVPLGTMFYHAFSFEDNTVPMCVILIIGFTVSILLQHILMWAMHTLTVVGLLVTFSFQAQKPEVFLKANENEVITLAVTYIMLYMVLAFSAAKLKIRYDRINSKLKIANTELTEKTNEIETQNEELVQSRDKLNELNQFLELKVEERTRQILQHKEQLLKYAYTNAHHVRGPVARVLGLIQLSKIDTSLDMQFIFEKIEQETREIDSIISRISEELDTVNN